MKLKMEDMHEYQKYSIEQIVNNKAFALFLDCGLGKTVVTLTANVEPCKGKSVPIVLWEITEDCETALDLYEGYPTFYVKKQVEILVDEKPTKAMIYVMAEEYTKLVAKPTDYYFNVIARGYYDNGLDCEPLQTAYEECLKELGMNIDG